MWDLMKAVKAEQLFQGLASVAWMLGPTIQSQQAQQAQVAQPLQSMGSGTREALHMGGPRHKCGCELARCAGSQFH